MPRFAIGADDNSGSQPFAQTLLPNRKCTRSDELEVVKMRVDAKDFHLRANKDKQATLAVLN